MKRPKQNLLTTINDTGLMIEKDCRLPVIKVYEENGAVLFWATVTDKDKEDIEALQYLSVIEAQKLANAIERCAIQALKKQ